MSSGFPGFPAEAMTFFRGLARHNDREWFLPRKAVFEERVKRPMWALVEAVNAELRGFAPEYVTDPAKAIYRFYRDTRFSKDKKPYKEQIAASFFNRALAAQRGAGFYFAVSHKEVAIGGGAYMVEPASLLAIRTRIAERHEELRRILKTASVLRLLGELQGDRLSRVPKGFCAEHPAADLLRFKQLYLYTILPPDVATTRDLYGEIVKRFRLMRPLLDFLNTALPRQRRGIDARELFQ